MHSESYKFISAGVRDPLEALGFDKILEVVSGYCHSDPSSLAVAGIRPFESVEDISARFRQVADIRRLSADGTPLEFEPFSDISPLIEKVRPEGSLLEPLELASLMPVLRTFSGIAALLKERTDLAALQGVIDPVLSGVTDPLQKIIERSIDSEGNILDTASSVLYELRGRRRGFEARIRKRLEDIVRDRSVAQFVQDDFISQRSGRWVIPVKMEAKGHVPGLVHDVSRTGETAFIEPLEIIGLANELENLVAEVKTEEIRILKSISKIVRAEADSILSQFEIIVYLDMLNAIARFSDRLRMNVPIVADSLPLSIGGARHPLLMLLKGEGMNEVVPLDLRLDSESSVMVITGPNAGGKTIAVKTAGLLLLMALSGMPVPADSSSTFPLLDSLLADIGDEQSIESSLSTFSAHVSNISSIIKKAGPRSLVILDELGTGTDPAEGAAIACAVLTELKKKGSFVIATTHLIDIVGFVHRTEGMANASMEFDGRTLTPLYRLRTGEPGQSHAIDIAEKYGLPESVLSLARGLFGTMKVEFQALVSDLKEQRAKFEALSAEAEKKTEELKAKDAVLSKRLSEAEREKKEIIRKAYEEARDVVVQARREVGAIIAGEKLKAKEAAKRLLKAQAEIEVKIVSESPPLKADEIREGDTVFVRSLGRDGRIAAIDEKTGRVKVIAGGITAEVPVSSIGPAKGRVGSPALSEKGGKREKTSPQKVSPEEEREAPLSLNIIGLRVDEATPKVEKFIDDALLDGLGSVTIIHGIGTGALQRAVREYLKGHPRVERFRKGEQSEGGGGVTVAVLK